MSMREIKDPDGGGWKHREIIDPKTNKRHTQYFFKNRRAPRIQLTSKVAQQLAGYSLIEKDLRNVLVWLNEINEIFPTNERPDQSHISPDRERFNIIKGLYVAALSFYGKCFTQCEGRKIKLEKKMIDEKYRETHDAIMHMRHNFAAHSGSDDFEEVMVALVLYPSKKTKMTPRIVRELVQADMAIDSKDAPVTFLQLVQQVRYSVLQKISLLEKRILEKEILPKGKIYWYARAKKS